MTAFGVGGVRPGLGDIGGGEGTLGQRKQKVLMVLEQEAGWCVWGVKGGASLSGVGHAGLVNHCEVRLLLQGRGVRAEV